MNLFFPVRHTAKIGLALLILTLASGAFGQALTLTVSPSPVLGGSPSQGTVTLKTGVAPNGGVKVALVSQYPTHVMVPASVSIEAGKASATFLITTVADTWSFDQLIEAKDSEFSAVAYLTVEDDAVQSVTFTSPSLGGGNSETATVNLTGAAPTGGWKVTLSSANPYVTVPASIVVPAGATKATFSVSAKVYPHNYAAAITAKDALTTKSTNLNIVEGTIDTVTLSSDSVIAGTAATGTVTLDSVAPYGGWKVFLSSSNAPYVAVPASITVPAGAKSATFIATTYSALNIYASTITVKCVTSEFLTPLNVSASTAVIQTIGGVSCIAYDPVHELLLEVPSAGVPLAPTSSQNAIFVVNPSTGATVKTVTLPAVSEIVQMSGDNTNILVACNDSTVRILDASTYALKGTANIPSGNLINLLAVPGTGASFAVDVDPWTYIYDGATQRPNKAAMGIISAISEDGTHYVGGDYRSSSDAYTVAKINALGFYDQVSGHVGVNPDLAYAGGHPVDGGGNVYDPNTGVLLFTLPFVSANNRQLSGVPIGTDVLSVSWGPDAAQVTNVATEKAVGTFNLPSTDGGLGPVRWAGHHRLVYYTYGYISDYQVVIIVNPLIP